MWDDRVEAEHRGHDADGKAEVAGAADGDGVLREQFTRLACNEFERIATRCDQAVFDGQLLGVREHLVDAAARLDRAGDRQGVVGFDQAAAFDLDSGDRTCIGEFD